MHVRLSILSVCCSEIIQLQLLHYLLLQCLLLRLLLPQLLLQLLFIGIFRLQLLLLLFLRLCFFLALFCPRRHRNDHYHHPKQNQYNEIRFISLFDPLSQDTVQKYSLPSPDILCFPSARQSHAAAALPLLFSFLPHRPKAAVPAR